MGLGSICLEASLQQEQPHHLQWELSAARDDDGFICVVFRVFHHKRCFYPFLIICEGSKVINGAEIICWMNSQQCESYLALVCTPLSSCFDFSFWCSSLTCGTNSKSCYRVCRCRKFCVDCSAVSAASDMCTHPPLKHTQPSLLLHDTMPRASSFNKREKGKILQSIIVAQDKPEVDSSRLKYK